MGKGNRNKLQRAQTASEVDQYLESSAKTNSKKEEKNKQKKKETRNGRIIAIICAVLAIAILLVLVGSVLQSAGVFARMTSILKMEGGHYKVDKAMMNFFFNEQIMSWYNQYGAYATYFGLDFSKDLKTQNYSSDTTWYAYFLNQTKSQVQLYLAYANAAHDMGLELDDEDRAEIDEVMASLDENIKAYGFTYEAFYGEGVSKKDIKDCYEIIYLANKYSEIMTEKYKEDLKKDDSAVIKYPEDNKESFYTADVLKYEIKVDEKGMTETEYDAAVKAAKERAEKIAAAETPEEFFELIKADLEALEADKDEGPAPKASKDDSTSDSTEKTTENVTEKATEAPTEATIDDYKETIEYTTSGGDLEDWLFGIEEESSTETREPAQVGDTFVEDVTETYTEKTTEKATEKSTEKATEDSTETATEATTTKKEYKKYTVTAYCVYEEMHLDTDLTRNLGYIVSTDKALVEKILADFKAGKMSAEALDKLGQAVADSLPEDTETAFGHSAPKQVVPGYFTSTDSTFKAIDEWLDAEERKPGDLSDIFEMKTTATSTTESTTYYALCYFEDYDKEVWYVNATTGTINDMFETWYQGEDGNGGYLAEHTVKYNEKEANDLYQSIVPYYLSLLSSSTTTS